MLGDGNIDWGGTAIAVNHCSRQIGGEFIAFDYVYPWIGGCSLSRKTEIRLQGTFSFIHTLIIHAKLNLSVSPTINLVL